VKWGVGKGGKKGPKTEEGALDGRKSAIEVRSHNPIGRREKFKRANTAET